MAVELIQFARHGFTQVWRRFSSDKPTKSTRFRGVLFFGESQSDPINRSTCETALLTAGVDCERRIPDLWRAAYPRYNVVLRPW